MAMVEVDDEEDTALPDLPPPATLAAIAQQDTDELRNEARRYAEGRLPWLRGTGRPLPKNYAEELVADAIADTWLGLAKWDPARCDLLIHVRGEILDRTSKEARHSRRFLRVPIDAAANDPIDAARIEEHFAFASFGDCSPIVFSALVYRVATDLIQHAANDEPARAILDCWRELVIERADVLARTQMSETAYKAARKRLLSLSNKLPPKLRNTVRELLRSAS